MSRYLDRLFSGVADRIADRVADRLSDEWRLESFELLIDPDAMEDLRRAARESDEDARPYEEVRRELGLA
jgi:hypothetical protein